MTAVLVASLLGHTARADEIIAGAAPGGQLVVRNGEAVAGRDTRTSAAASSEPEAALAALARLPLAAQRHVMYEQLVALDYTEHDARAATSRLTADDLAVLLQNPDMMQRAGEISTTTWAIILLALLVVGLIVLASSSSGFVMINP